MKKRIFTLMLAAVLLFSLSACEFLTATPSKDSNNSESSMNAYELYTKMMEKNDSTFYGATMDGDLLMSMQGMTMEMGIDQIFEYNNNNFNLTYSLTAMGSTNTIDVTYVNGVAYIKEGGEKYRMTVDGEELIDGIGAINFFDFGDESDESNSFDEIISEEKLKETKVTVKDGKLSFTVDVNAEKANELFGGTMGDLGDGETTYKDASVTVTCDKDYHLVSVSISVEMDTVSDGVPMNINATLVMKDFVTEKPTIKAPSNKNNYTNYDDLYV